MGWEIGTRRKPTNLGSRGNPASFFISWYRQAVRRMTLNHVFVSSNLTTTAKGKKALYNPFSLPLFHVISDLKITWLVQTLWRGNCKNATAKHLAFIGQYAQCQRRSFIGHCEKNVVKYSSFRAAAIGCRLWCLHHCLYKQNRSGRQ